MNMTHGSLFSGIGGFDLAAQWAGFDNVFHCEWNPFAQQILKYHFPNSESYEDITKSDFTKHRGKVDIISGGFPCQPFSCAGQRKGADDDRYLWPQMLRVIREVQPSWVIGENVAGIATMVQPGQEVEVGGQTSIFGESDTKDVSIQQEYVIETVCSDLEREGYSVQPIVIPACAIGAPHRRDRVWFVAHRTNARTESVQCRGENGVFEHQFVANTTSERDTSSGKGSETQSNGCKDNGQSELWGEQTERVDGSFGFLQSIANPDSTRFQTSRPEQPTTRTARDGSSGVWATTPNSESSREQGQCEQGQRESKSHRRDCEKVSTRWSIFPTQSPVCRGSDGLPFDVDNLTVSFGKWRTESVKAYGNAIVPQVAYEIFKAIKEYQP